MPTRGKSSLHYVLLRTSINSLGLVNLVSTAGVPWPRILGADQTLVEFSHCKARFLTEGLGTYQYIPVHTPTQTLRITSFILCALLQVLGPARNILLLYSAFLL